LLISQSSVSAAVKTLEEEFEVKLIKRRESNYDSLELTEAGKCFYFIAKEILNFKEKLYKKIETFKGEGETSRRETVSITTNAAIGVHLLPKLIERFKLNFDKLNLKIIIETSNYSSMVNLLKNGICDIGIVPVDINVPFTNLVCTFEQKVSIITNKKFLVSIDSFQDFEKLPLVLLPKSFIVRKLLDDFFSKNNILPNIVLELNYPLAIKELIKTENFVTILHYTTVKEEINRGEFIELTPAFKLPFLTYKLIVNQESSTQDYIHEITHFFKNNLNKNFFETA